MQCCPQAGDPASVQHGSPQAHCLLTRNLLFDLELLAHTDYFIGTTKSGLSPLVEVPYLHTCGLGFIWPEFVIPSIAQDMQHKWQD